MSRYLKRNQVYNEDNCRALKKLQSESVDLIYLDPPFFTQKMHSLSNREGSEFYNFSDKFEDINAYILFLKERLLLCRNVLAETGSLFLHCDKTASHYIKVMLDEVFGVENFRSEIIWTYKRWSNAKKGLLNQHQNIFFYSKSEKFKFNTQFEDYSPATNVDQIVQLRSRDLRNKVVYKKNSDGTTVLAAEKKGVPLGDVWDIPFLNPKANERVGYPTQKPILLLEKIINLVTNAGDLVLDPFCGSGSTLVAAKMLNRQFIGIDINSSAVKLAEKRLEKPVKTESMLLQKGRQSYLKQDAYVKEAVKSLSAVPVQRNKGIDGLVSLNKCIIPFKVVESFEQLTKAAENIKKSVKTNSYKEKALYLENFNDNDAKVKDVEQKYDVIVFKDLKNLNKKLNDKSKSL